jgi:branched-chain amino acid transport system permease protein
MDRRTVWLSSLVVLVVVLVAFFGTGYHRSILIFAGTALAAVTGLALLVGYAGQLSLAQGAFFGLGAYGYGVLAVRFGWHPLLAAGAALLLAAVVGYVLGIPMLRLRGHFLALGTLAFALIVIVLANEWSRLTGGPSGLLGIPGLRTQQLGGLTLRGDVQYSVLAGLLAVGSFWLFERVTNSDFGLALKAMSSSEVATQAMGVDVVRLKLLVFTLAAVLAALGGVVFASYLNFISPSAFDVLLAIEFVVMVMLGGAASALGPLVGTVSVAVLVEVLRAVVPLIWTNVRGPIEMIALGLVLGLLMVVRPEGLVTLWRRRGRHG